MTADSGAAGGRGACDTQQQTYRQARYRKSGCVAERAVQRQALQDLSWAALSAHETTDELIGGRREQVSKSALLHDTPGAQQHDLIGEVPRLAHLVRHQHYRFAELTEYLPELSLQVGADHRIQGTERLVEQQHFGIEHQRPHQADTLALPARELDRVAAQPVRWEMRQLGQRRYACGAQRLVPAQVTGDERYVVERREVREQPTVLDDVAHPATHFQQVGGGQLGGVERYAALIRAHQPDHQTQDRRLAAAAGADEHGRLTRSDTDIQRVQGDVATEALGNAGQLEHDRPV